MLVNSAQLAASQEGLSSKELVTALSLMAHTPLTTLFPNILASWQTTFHTLRSNSDLFYPS
jgi:hypothetical protein